MFGYFKFNERYSTYEMQNAYKNYYCGTCFALQLHYGQLSRLLLSYDITLFAIIMKLHKDSQCDRIECFGQAKCKKKLFLGEDWKKIAALNILITSEKCRDDIHDSKSVKAFVAQLIYGRTFKKAKKDFPAMANCIRKGYNKFILLEKSNSGLNELSECCAEMMVNTIESVFSIDDIQREYIYEISRWLYVIDALDDYDKDAKKGEFNPFVQDSFPFTEYINDNYLNIQELISDLNYRYSLFIQKYETGSVEEQILASIVKDTIPANTAMVLNEVKHKIRMRKIGNVWKKVL